MYYDQLGKCVTEYQQAVRDLLEDPMNDYAGFTPDPEWYLNQLVRRWGFVDINHFHEQVTLRTTARWVHMNLY